MPLHAVGERKYFGSGFGSKMADKEHALPSLGQAEVLRVQHPPGPHIPDFLKPLKDDRHVAPRMASKHSFTGAADSALITAFSLAEPLMDSAKSSNGSAASASTAGQQARDVLDENERGTECRQNACELEPQT
jgi:hypothetical protein